MAVKGKKTGNDGFYGLIVSGGVDVPDDKVIDDIFAERTTKHAEDAIDYEDIDELAEDDEPMDDDSLTAAPAADGDALLKEEVDLQADANGEFDALFGGEDQNGEDHDNFAASDLHMGGADRNGGMDILHDMNNQIGFEDDGLHDLGLGFEEDHADNLGLRPYSGDDNALAQRSLRQKTRKRKSPEELAAKETKLRKLVSHMQTHHKARMVEKYFPEYSPNEPFNHHLMVLAEPKYYAYKRPPIAFRPNLKPLIPLKLTLDIEADQKKAFKSKRGYAPEAERRGIVDITSKDLDFLDELMQNGDLLLKVKYLPFIQQDSIENDKFADFSKDMILATADWDDDKVVDAGASDSEAEPKQDHELYGYDNFSYDDDNIFNGQAAPKTFELNMNDPNLLFVPEKRRKDSSKTKAIVPSDFKLLVTKYNISNDKGYEILKNNYNTKVRSQLSNLNIEHSVPAMRLQTPYYKIKMTKEEARAFHRAKFQIRQGSLICFSKPKLRKKKKDRGKTPLQIFRKTSDLTACDSATLIGMEYSEEYPRVLSGFGMCSKLINYYRKEREDDNSRPKAPLGETHVLGVEDRSPFWNFGHVAKGDFVPTLYNNMIRAPIFKQEMKNTDFIMIRSLGCGSHQRHYLRPVDHLFAVGNIFPAVEIPAPHSRKVTNTSKNRLKMVVFRTMNRNGAARLSVKDIALHFPDQNDMQNRQRLKEFMEYQRQGEHQGYWKIRNSDTVPTEEEIRAMITPEDATLLDCMQHGLQVLDDIDSLYNDDSRRVDPRKEKREKEREKEREREREKEKEKENDENEEKEKTERKRRDKDVDIDETIDEGLTPWSSSRSFIISNQTKAMLQLNGEGDPTGIGLGFSLLRATQKHGFRPLIPPPKDTVPKNTTAAYHQKLYENEISRIWYAQRSSLTVGDRHGHTLDDVYREYKPIDHTEFIKGKIEKERKDKIKNEGQAAADKNVLKITRLVRDENNVVQRRVEYVSDPRLIKAYIKRKKQIEGDKMSMADVNEILPTNDAEMNKIRRKALEEKIANLQKRAKLSKGRKPHKDPLHLAAAAGGKIIDANTVLLPDGSIAFGGKGIGKGKSTTRRCASCGAFGHIRTKKTCPLYYHTKGGTVQISQEQKDILLASLKKDETTAAPLGGSTPATQS